MPNIKDIITTGKLIGYSVTGGFLDVYWQTPELEEHVYWLFKFTSMDSKLISINKINSNSTYGRWQAKRYVPMIERLMYGLIQQPQQ